ncbi:MAG: hypothetical protein ACRDHL_07105 [Candidatus Promineifilaceae bacterium]
MTKGIMTQQKVTLSGKRHHYVITSALLSFLAVLSFYLGLQNYYGAPMRAVCLGAGAIVALVNLTVTSSRLKYVSFEHGETSEEKSETHE